MKSFFCCFTLFCSTFCNCQINENQVIIHKDLKYKSLELGSGTVINKHLLRDNSELEGTCFVIKQKNKYYIATNYHLLTGRLPWAINTFDSVYVKGQTPNTLFVFFYNKNGSRSPQVYPLLDSNKKRLFLTPKPDSNNRILDLAFLPIKNIPKDAIIDPIQLSYLDTNLYIKEKSEVLIYGFRGDRSASLKFPVLDTAITIIDFPFHYNDEYIFCNKTIPFHGSSGAPVYFKTQDNLYSLVGIVSKETNSTMAISIDPEMIRIKELKLLYEFVSISAIKREFKRLILSTTK